VLAFGVCSLSSLFAEAGQAFIEYRMTSILDWGTNTAGAIVGASAGRHLLSRYARNNRGRPEGVILSHNQSRAANARHARHVAQAGMTRRKTCPQDVPSSPMSRRR
jgi:hypothetical protein